MKILVATHNRGKLLEFRRMFEGTGVDIIGAGDLDRPLSEPEETGSTFAENAEIKAAAAVNETGIAAVGDDSGLCVDALDGRPGIYTARYGGGHDVPFRTKMELMIGELRDVPDIDRTARFVCSLCLMFPDGRKITAEGECRGMIGHMISGTAGFGFDPVFYIGDRSMAELTPAEKDAVSHRGTALRRLFEEMKKEGII
ncbi:MAG: RdgB/HAM1 family non-canonical purine NTP pyrophosphatase [Clostridia bacterium]|nr:RdgB/HAM1 family non-canonical purine NTP pyrophosphatase [Clostridia bacterium]